MVTSTTIDEPPAPVVVPMILLHRSLRQFQDRLDEVNDGLYCFEGGYLSLVRRPEGMLQVRAQPPARYEDPDDRNDDPEAFPSTTVAEDRLMTAGLAWLGGLWQNEPSIWSENGMLHPETQAHLDRLNARIAKKHEPDESNGKADGKDEVEPIEGFGPALNGIGDAILKRQAERRALCAEMLAKERALIGRSPADTLTPGEIVGLAKAIGEMGDQPAQPDEGTDDPAEDTAMEAESTATEGAT